MFVPSVFYKFADGVELIIAEAAFKLLIHVRRLFPLTVHRLGDKAPLPYAHSSGKSG